MWRYVLLSVFAATLSLLSGPLCAQVGQSGVVSPIEAGRAGLKRSWYTHVEVDRARGKMAYISQHVSTAKSTTIFEIAHDRGQIVISEKHLDPFGLPLGKDGAKLKADEKVQELKDLGLNPEVTAQIVPDVTLYVATDRGVVQAFDGETGKTRWSAPVGKMNHPTLEPAANDRDVAIVNGSILYILSAEDGRLKWQKQLKGAPGAGGALTGDLVHVPMINGMLESYALNDGTRPVVFFKSHGRAMIQPISTDKSVIWTTDRGHMYVGHGDKPGVRYRLECNDTIASRASYKAPNLIFVTSVDGYLYCVQELSGDVLWRFSAGEPLSQTPVVVDDAVYVVSDPGNLFRVSINNGQEKWSTPRVKGILSASKDRLYCSGDAGAILVIDQASGTRITSFDGLGLDVRFMNGETDRLYLGTSGGIIQCLHEPALRYPLVHAGLGGEQKEKPQVVQKGLEPGDEGEPAKPAGGEVDPFGGEKKPAADPFGGEKPADPFGGGKEADPFGAGPAPAPAPAPKPAAPADDPFGG